jgi:thiosulfate/3-mercaptopyruvate sulfurtransferase
MEAAPAVVDVDWVAANRDKIRLVDVRETWEYEGIGHLPGAVNIPFDAVRGTGEEDEGHLPGVQQFERVMSQAGIVRDEPIVAYDDEHGVFAARFLVTAMFYGHSRWHLLNGDYSAWCRLYDTVTEIPRVEPIDYDVVVPTDRPMLDADGVQAAIEDADAVLVDTRSPEEFAEGHIDEAVNIDWRELVEPETRGLKPPEDLMPLLASFGITPDKRIVLYCNTARRISHTYIVLRHLGFEAVEFYEGSLTDWSTRNLELFADQE